ncbi:MAG: TfoX/Sxy family protein [Planctomycetia bacterium]|nr:TfoX/Sxy family protein [Planctomycetia bacterium]
MSYDEKLAKRIQKQVGRAKGVTSKAMFGGIAWLLGGNMFAGIVKDELMVRVGPERHAELLREPCARPMDFTGRPMKGYLFVEPGGVKSEKDLGRWLQRATEFVATLPAKKKKAARR